MPKSSAFVLATDREVQSARSQGKRAEYRIKGAKNLLLRITPSGAKTWTFLYASPSNGKRSKLSLGSYPAKSLADARDEALALTLTVKAGNDPLARRRAEDAAESFENLADAYMREHERKYARSGKRSGWTDEVWRLLRADILPKIGDNKAETLTKRHVMNVVETVAERGAYVTADRVLGLIRAIYNWAAGTGRLEVNPTFGLKKRNAGRPRKRVLSDTEIRTLWRTLDLKIGLSGEIRDALKLQLLLGLRRSEVLGATKNEVNLERCVWTLPAQRTKARREHALPIPSLAVRILKRAIGRAGESPWLFPSPAIENVPVRPRSASRALLRLRNDIGLTDVGTHDLRRTLATGLGNMCIADEVIERILNHAPRTVAGRHYNHATHFEPMRRALEAWANRVKAIVEGREPEPNVVLLRAVGE